MKMNKVFNGCNIYLALSCLVQLLPPSSLKLAITFVILAISIYYTGNVFKSYLRQYLRGLISLLILFTLYGVALIIESPIILGHKGDVVSNTSYIVTIYLSLLPIFVFYYFAKKKYLQPENLKIWIIILLCTTTYSYFSKKGELLSLALESGVSVDAITNNVSYMFLAIIPLLCSFKDRGKIQLAALLYCFVFVILSMKRGAMLIGCVLIVLFFIWHLKTSKTNISYFKYIILFAISIGAIYYLFDHLLTTNDYFAYKMTEAAEGASGREDGYTFIWNYFLNKLDSGNYLNCIFGEGANASIRITGNYAHNDWLEILINQGVVGIIIYSVYWLKYYKNIKLTYSNSDVFFPLLMIFSEMFLQSIYSMSYSGMCMAESLSLGYYLALSESRNKV